MLNMKKVELELISDADINLFLGKDEKGGMRSEVCYISKRCS